jgi:hypothetical protein
MEDKVKKWKRRWKKLNIGDRRFLQIMTFIALAYVILSIFNIVYTPYLVWIGAFVYLFFALYGRCRYTAYKSYNIGRKRQQVLFIDSSKALMSLYWKVHNENRKLHSDYKKLEYDYNQLKKSINNPKKNKK